MKLKGVSIVIQLIFLNCEALLKSLKAFQNKNFTNLKILENPIDALLGQNWLSCNIFCLETRSCLSYSYNFITGTCLPWNKDFINVSTTNVTSENGWMYYYAVKDCSITDKMCSANSGFLYEPETCFCYQYLATKYLYNETVSVCKVKNSYPAKIDRGLIQRKMEEFLDTVIDGEVRIQGELDNITDILKNRDGAEVTYFNWNKVGGQPDHQINELYIIIRKSKGYLWHDVKIHERYAAICQMTNV